MAHEGHSDDHQDNENNGSALPEIHHLALNFLSFVCFKMMEGGSYILVSEFLNGRPRYS